jgi:two-component system cell cycle response regulator DivK
VAYPILIVEDEPAAREAYAEILAGEGFEVELAADGMEAIFKAKAKKPALVVLDIGLPRLDGFYVADLWQRDPAMADVPVIGVSAFFDPHNQERAKQAGCALTLVKPFPPEELRLAVRRLLRRGG